MNREHECLRDAHRGVVMFPLNYTCQERPGYVENPRSSTSTCVQYDEDKCIKLSWGQWNGNEALGVKYTSNIFQHFPNSKDRTRSIQSWLREQWVVISCLPPTASKHEAVLIFSAVTETRIVIGWKWERRTIVSKGRRCTRTSMCTRGGRRGFVNDTAQVSAAGTSGQRLAAWHRLLHLQSPPRHRKFVHSSYPSVTCSVPYPTPTQSRSTLVCLWSYRQPGRIHDA